MGKISSKKLELLERFLDKIDGVHPLIRDYATNQYMDFYTIPVERDDVDKMCKDENVRNIVDVYLWLKKNSKNLTNG